MHRRYASASLRPFLRFLAITLGITGMYMALDQMWLALTPGLASVMSGSVERRWHDEVADVVRSSREADRRLPSSSRLVAYRLGLEVGYCSNLLGSFATSPPEIQARAREALAPRLSTVRALGQSLGLDDPPLVPVANADQFARISERIEADETGLATRVETATSLRHRHLYLLGMHVGVSAALADVLRGQTFGPVREYIGHHATVAGVPASAWEPVAEAPAGANPEERWAAYRAAVDALQAAISTLEPWP